MVTDKQLTSKLQELRGIKPSKEWAFSLKLRILGEEKQGFSLISDYFKIPYFKPALATLLSVFLLFATFAFSQNSVPGDFLYPVKKLTEKSKVLLVSEQERQQASLESATKRLEELAKVAETNRVKNLPSAINEAQESISEASKSLLVKNTDPVAVKRIVDGIEAKVLAVKDMGIDFEVEAINELTEASNKYYAEYVISDLETRTLLKEQEEVLAEMKALAEEGKYSEAIIAFEAKFYKQAEETDEVIEEAKEEITEEIEETEAELETEE